MTIMDEQILLMTECFLTIDIEAFLLRCLSSWAFGLLLAFLFFLDALLFWNGPRLQLPTLPYLTYLTMVCWLAIAYLMMVDEKMGGGLAGWLANLLF